MKSILVIDTPENCDKCRLMHTYFDHDYGWIKVCIGSGVNDCIVFERKLEDYCPLKPIPQKEDEFEKGLNAYSMGWRIGYNYCIDELLGCSLGEK